MKPFLIAALLGFTPSQGLGQGSIPVDGDMVFLPVVVTTQDGKYVTDLTKDDVQVFEDKIPQQILRFVIPEEPLSVVIAVDASGTATPMFKLIQNEALRLIHLLRSQDSIAILSFAKDVSLLENFSTDRIRLASAINRITPWGPSALYDAVGIALDKWLNSLQQRSALVLFTDGLDNASTIYRQAKTLEHAQRKRIPIYCMYFDANKELRRVKGIPESAPSGSSSNMPDATVSGSDPNAIDSIWGRRVYLGTGATGGAMYLRTLSKCSGGKTLDISKTQDLGKELASRYTIGYFPTSSKRDGKIRKVEVRISRQGLQVHTLREYLAPKDPNPRK